MRISDWSSDVCSSDLTQRMTGRMSLCVELSNKRPKEMAEREMAGTGRGGAERTRPRAPERYDSIVSRNDVWLSTANMSVTNERRSEERRVGKEGGSTCRTRGAHDHTTKKDTKH